MCLICVQKVHITVIGCQNQPLFKLQADGIRIPAKREKSLQKPDDFAGFIIADLTIILYISYRQIFLNQAFDIKAFEIKSFSG